MSARERKIIHEEISFMNELETESVGEEPKRCLVIKKKR
jgi:spoIIIJ-associated protein